MKLALKLNRCCFKSVIHQINKWTILKSLFTQTKHPQKTKSVLFVRVCGYRQDSCCCLIVHEEEPGRFFRGKAVLLHSVDRDWDGPRMHDLVESCLTTNHQPFVVSIKEEEKIRLHPAPCINQLNAFRFLFCCSTFNLAYIMSYV